MSKIRHCPAVFTEIEYGDNTEFVTIVSYVDNDFCYHLTLRNNIKDAFIIGPDKLKKYTFDELREKQHLRITCDPEPKYDFELWACLFDCDPETISRKIIHNYYDLEKMSWDFAKVYIQDIVTGNIEYDSKKPKIICVSFDDDELLLFYAGIFFNGVFKEININDDSDNIDELFKVAEKTIDWESFIQK